MPEHPSTQPVVTLFGPLEIRTGNVVTSQFRSNRVKALLAYLLLHPGASRREEIADRLWPNLDETAGRNNLRVTLQYLKQALSAHGLEGAILAEERSRLGIESSHVNTDVAMFRQLVRDLRTTSTNDLGSLERAIALARAPLTPALYDEWLEPHRTELNQERYTILLRLAGAYLEQDPARALELARTAAVEHPYLSEPRELVAEALIRLGEPSTAIADLMAFESELREEIGSKPSATIDGLIRKAAEAARSYEVPAVRTLNLPFAYTRFFGRESELDKIRDWAIDPDQRLLTIYGPGGVGKTRLATEAARRVSDLDVIWVEAEAVTTGEALLEQIARAASPGQQSADPLEGLRIAMRRGPAIAVLDNVEQIPDAELRWIERLLRTVPSLKIMATSRKTLGFAGERLMRIEPLSPQGEAVELFLDRARSCRPDFPDDEDSLARVREVCSRVEGIPLAIELAAARLISVSIFELAGGMERRLDLLVSQRSPEARHGAMRSTIEWSFSQLQPSASDRILSLGILQSTWTAEAAAALFDDRASVADTLQTAVENSLLSVLQAKGKTRYRMLECVREYCLDKMPSALQDTLKRRSAAHYRELAKGVRSHEQLNDEWPNIEGAIRTLAANAGDLGEALDLCASVLPFLADTGNGAIVLTILGEIDPPDELRPKLLWLRGALQLSGSRFSDARDSATEGLRLTQDPTLQARLRVLRARALLMEGQIDNATEDAEAALSLTARSSDLLRRDALLTAAKAAYNRLDNARALEMTQQARRLTWEHKDVAMYADLIDMLGLLHNRLGDFESSERVFREILDPKLSAGEYGHGRAWGRLGEVAILLGDTAAAIARFETGLELTRKAQDHWATAQILVHLGESLLKVGRLDGAAEAFAEALQIRNIAGERLGLGACYQGMARVKMARGEFAGAAEDLEVAISHCRQISDHRLLFRLLVFSSCVWHALGDFEKAVERGREVIDMLQTGRADQTEEELAEIEEDLSRVCEWASDPH